MIRALHIEVPRALTTTVKPPDFRLARELVAHGIECDFADLNMHFWSHVLGAGTSGLCIEHFFAPHLSKAVVNKLGIALAEIRERSQLPLTPMGCDFGLAAQSSLRISPLLQRSPRLAKFLEGYFEQLAGQLGLADANLRLISLGVDSQHSLILGCAMATQLRKLVGGRSKIVLGKHGYENFSLRHKRNSIQANRALDEFLDAVVFNEEELSGHLVKLCGRPIARSAAALPADFESELLDRARFLPLLPAAPDLCAVYLPLSRNRCYWNRCTFCIQIRKHAVQNQYENSSELKSAFREISALRQAGFRYFIFADEAMSPANIRRLCDFLEGQGIDIKWTPRLIADTDFDEELVRRMARLGCFEVLFGLETASPDTAKAMGKVSADAGAADIMALAQRFGDVGVAMFINLIYGFPTEGDVEFEQTFRLLADIRTRVRGITAQFNKFALFHGSDVHTDPARFGLRRVEQERAEIDLKLTYDYEDRFGRMGSTPANAKYFAASLGLEFQAYRKLVALHGAEFVGAAFQLNYASFGLIHKDSTGEELVTHCW